MDLGEQVAALEAALHRLGVTIREVRLGEEARLAGGLCRLRGTPVVLVDPTRSLTDRREALLSALTYLDTDRLWLPPAVRELLAARVDP